MTLLAPHIYFDPDVFDREMKTIFANAPGYVGHEKIVPKVGDFYTLEHKKRLDFNPLGALVSTFRGFFYLTKTFDSIAYSSGLFTTEY